MMKLDRRKLMKAAGGLMLFSGISRSAVFAQPLGANPFTLGVASGDPWPDGFVIWTRLAPRPLDEHGGMPAVRVPVRWEVSEDENFAHVVRKGEVLALPELSHSVHIDVEGLRPHRRYWYRFAVAGSDVSPVGTVRTAPGAGVSVDRLRIAVAGCQHYESGFYDAWGHMANEPDLDLIFHYGDYIYEHPSPAGWNVVRQQAGTETYSLDDYRRRYAQYKSDQHLQAAHAACAFASSFDDHEVDNNWAADLDQDGTPPEIFALRRFAALQAWYENMPVRKAQFPRFGGVMAYRRLDYGRLLRMHVLDTRSFRTDQPCGDNWRKPCPLEAYNSPDMLGAKQESWLNDGLDNAATWNLLAQQVLMMSIDAREPGAQEANYYTDTWAGYRPARARLISSILEHQLTNVVIATGDAHRHGVGLLPERDDIPDGKKVATEFLASSISSEGDGKGEEKVSHFHGNNPHLDLYTDRRGYQLFTITPEEWITDIKVMDHVEKPGGKISMLAQYMLKPEAPTLYRS